MIHLNALLFISLICVFGAGPAHAFKLNEEVYYVVSDARVKTKITEVKGGGNFVLSNGETVYFTQIKNIVQELAGYKVNQDVVCTQIDKRPTNKIVEITGDGYFLLDNGVWVYQHSITAIVPSLGEGLTSIEMGNEVSLINVDKNPVAKVLKVTRDKHVQVSDGSWHYQTQVSKIVESHSGYFKGQEVVETVSRKRSIQKILRLRLDSHIQLEDGDWYYVTQVEALVPSKDGFEVGEEVMVGSSRPTVQKITHIARDGYYRVEDGTWHYRLTKLIPSHNGIAVNDRVVSRYNTKSGVRIVAAISKDGNYLVDDGELFGTHYLYKCVNSGLEVEDKNNRRKTLVGQEVALKDGSDWRIVKVAAILSNGYHLLTNGDMYEASDIHTFETSYKDINEYDMVLEKQSAKGSVRRVLRVTHSGIFCLSDDRWYEYSQIELAK